MAELADAADSKSRTSRKSADYAFIFSDLKGGISDAFCGNVLRYPSVSSRDFLMGTYLGTARRRDWHRGDLGHIADSGIWDINSNPSTPAVFKRIEVKAALTGWDIMGHALKKETPMPATVIAPPVVHLKEVLEGELSRLPRVRRILMEQEGDSVSVWTVVDAFKDMEVRMRVIAAHRNIREQFGRSSVRLDFHVIPGDSKTQIPHAQVVYSN
jgi:hypothetical protein